MEFTAAQIASFINGTVEGNPNAIINGFGKIEEAKATELTFFANPKYEPFVYLTQAGVIILNASYELQQPIAATLIRVPDAYKAFATLLSLYDSIVNSNANLVGIETPSFIHETAQLGENVYVGAFAYIGEGAVIGNHVKIYPNAYIGKNVVIGDHTVINPHVNIYHNCKIGTQCIIHSGTIVGSDGFGFAPQADGSYQKVPQLGNVIIEDFVEIGSNTTIDRATIGSTIIETGVKLDNLIQIAHNAVIGKHTVIAAQAGISGSTRIGEQCIIGGQAGVVGHIQLANGTKVNAQSGMTKTVKEENKSFTGSPAGDFKATLRQQALVKQLPDLLERIAKLEQLLAEK